MAAYLAMALALPILAACVSDVRRRIIPDWTVLAILLAGVAHSAAAGTLADAASGTVIALGAGVLMAWSGAWGWGDAKLVGAVGAVTGADGLSLLLLGTALAGGLLAAVLLVLRAPVQAGRLALPAGAPRWLRAEQSRLRRAPSVPYGLAIVAGLALFLLTGA
jgi:Flp pilus assembly protein protease CpaA